MVVTLSFTKGELSKIVRELQTYPSLPTPSKYEQLRCQVGTAIVTVYTSGKIVIQSPNKDVEKSVQEKILSWMGSDTDELVFGIDEVGRGERDGPLVVSGVLGYRNKLRGLRDSKKTSNVKNKYAEATQNSLMQCTVSINAETIDELRKKGITMNDIEATIAIHIHQLSSAFYPHAITIMDGRPLKKGLKGIVFQEKADDIEPSVSAASITAKHTRNESGDHGERKTWKKK